MNCITDSHYVASKAENVCYLPPRLLSALTAGCLGRHAMLEDIPKTSVITNQTLFSPTQLHILQTIHTLPIGHTTLSHKAYNLTMNKLTEPMLPDLPLMDEWQTMHCDRMLPQLKLLSHHESRKQASSMNARFHSLRRSVAKHKMTCNNRAGYENTYPPQDFVTALCMVNTANLLPSKLAYILPFNASCGKNRSIYFSNKC